MTRIIESIQVPGSLALALGYHSLSHRRNMQYAASEHPPAKAFSLPSADNVYARWLSPRFCESGITKPKHRFHVERQNWIIVKLLYTGTQLSCFPNWRVLYCTCTPLLISISFFSRQLTVIFSHLNCRRVSSHMPPVISSLLQKCIYRHCTKKLLYPCPIGTN